MNWLEVCAFKDKQRFKQFEYCIVYHIWWLPEIFKKTTLMLTEVYSSSRIKY
jgi:hypothetical protein